MKQRLVSSLAELDSLEAVISEAARSTAERLARELQGADALGALARLKFTRSGCDPLDLTRALNFVEQLNQSFTYLASIQAARWLFHHHGGEAPFLLNLGTSPGSDVASTNGSVVAEIFAATHPDSNDKLRNDIRRVRSVAARHRYVFYLSPVAASDRGDCGDVRVIRLDHPSLSAPPDPGI